MCFLTLLVSPEFSLRPRNTHKHIIVLPTTGSTCHRYSQVKPLTGGFCKRASLSTVSDSWHPVPRCHTPFSLHKYSCCQNWIRLEKLKVRFKSRSKAALTLQVPCGFWINIAGVTVTCLLWESVNTITQSREEIQNPSKIKYTVNRFFILLKHQTGKKWWHFRIKKSSGRGLSDCQK